MDLFLNDPQESSLTRNPPDDLDELLVLHESELSEMLHKDAPIKKQTVTIRPAAPWFSEKNKL